MTRIDIGGAQGRHPDGVEVGKPASRLRDSLIADCPPDDGAYTLVGLLLAVVIVCLLAVSVLVACAPPT